MVPSALCVCLCATAFLSVLLHVRSTCSHHRCCGVLSCAGRLSSCSGVLLPHTSRGCEPCLVFVFSVHGPVTSCTTASLYHDPAIPEIGLK